MIQQFIRLVKRWLLYSPIWLVLFAIAAGSALWAFIEYRLRKYRRIYSAFNIIMLAFTVYLVIGSTLLHREASGEQPSLIPFDLLIHSFENEVIFRTILLNIILFIPIGLFGSASINSRKKASAVILIVSAALFSVFIEIMQYVLAVGQADIDDVICNTLGALVGRLIYDLYNRYLIDNKLNLKFDLKFKK